MTQDTQLLIIDDDQAFRARLAKSFELRGYRTQQLGAIVELEQSLDDFAPTHAVVDLCLKGESGLEAVSLLLARYKAKVVVLTGYSSAATAIEAVRLGAVNYLSKPVELEQLLRALFGPPLAAATAQDFDPRSVSLAQIEWEHIQRVLRDCGGNITHAAKHLGIHRQALQRRLRTPP